MEVPKGLVGAVCEFPQEYRSKIMKIALAASQPLQNDRSRILEKFSQDTGISKDHIFDVLSVYLLLIRIFLRSNDREFKEKLQELGFPMEFIESFPLLGNRLQVVENLDRCENPVGFERFNKINWKLDLSLGNSVLAKKLQTKVYLEIFLKSGRKLVFELDEKAFHSLRFNVATILKEMRKIEALYHQKT